MKMKDSGLEWLGDIPAHWKICRVKNIFSLRSEKNYLPLEEVQLLSLYTDIGVFKHGEFEEKGNKAITAEGYKEVYPDDIVVNIILSWMGAIGRSNYRGVTSPAYDIYKPSKNICSKFYHYLFRTTGFSGECYKYGRGIMEMRWRTYSTEFKAIKIPLPPLEEQQKISAYLDKKCAAIDTAVDAAKKMVVKLGEYKKALITETVTKGLNPAAKMQDSGVEWLGDIPAHWKICRLKNLATIKNGQDYKNFFDENGKYPVMGSGGEFARATNFIYDKPSVLLGRKGTIDKPLFVDFPFWTVDTMYYTEIKDTVCKKFFFYLCVQIPYSFYQYGSAVPSMTQRDLNSVKFPLPPLEEQKEISAYLDAKCAAIDKNIAKHQQLAEELTEYKKSLIYEVVTGKMEV